ncbi:hypothetical protein ACFQT0_02900 [Hymenobacter humi]|uniref:CheB-type methylesterase domain-containing protein n=1 Tax=Hymenobacter humi TaxID=1411620 RepID=A0ABW2U1I8_9BACT
MPLTSSVAAPRGTLVMLGGGDDDPMLALLAGLLPGPSAIIEVLTTATRRQPARTAAAYAHSWHHWTAPTSGIYGSTKPTRPTTPARWSACARPRSCS